MDALLVGASVHMLVVVVVVLLVRRKKKKLEAEWAMVGDDYLEQCQTRQFAVLYLGSLAMVEASPVVAGNRLKTQSGENQAVVARP